VWKNDEWRTSFHGEIPQAAKQAAKRLFADEWRTSSHGEIPQALNRLRKDFLLKGAGFSPHINRIETNEGFSP
jgi:hypothetical protein